MSFLEFLVISKGTSPKLFYHFYLPDVAFPRPSTVEAEEIMNDGITSDSVRRKPAPKKRDEIAKVFNLETFTTDWGPKGFSKRLHPLSMMVRSRQLKLCSCN